MLKIGIYILLISSILYSSDMIAYNEDRTASFIKNQKYVCINTSYSIEGKVIKNDNIEEALKYPIRFYVDDNNVFNTDKGMRLNLLKQSEGISAYGNKTTAFILIVKSETEKLLITPVPNKKGMDMEAIYRCTWTENWTLAK